VGPADHFSVLSLGSVAVGNAKTGPAPQTKPTPGATGIGFFGEKKKAGLKSPQPEIGTIATEEWRLVDHRHDRAGDQVPILIEVKRDNRLNVEDVLGVIELTHAKVRIVLKRRRPDQTRPECRPRRRRPPRGRRVTMATTGSAYIVCCIIRARVTKVLMSGPSLANGCGLSYLNSTPGGRPCAAG
jgi:hypothetical protein